ncbi:MAG: hypothetical protein K6E84_02675 [Lachnospiraceae bacterium]|nr:hypothetical protein [Lachnospiraceae bacterium]
MLQESPVRYALVLLDLLMPVMDGETFLAKMKSDERLSGIPVIDNAIANRDLMVFFQPKYGIQEGDPKLRPR